MTPQLSPRLRVIGIVVQDMAAALAFYRRLGIDIPSDQDREMHVDAEVAPGVRLAWDTVDVIRAYDPAWTPASGGHRIALSFECADPAHVDARYAELLDAGVAGHLPPWDAFWGQRYATVHDPDGNTIDLFAALPTAG